MIFKNTGFIIIMVALVISSCDPCQDCGVVTLEPTVDVQFINETQLLLNEDSLEVIDTLFIWSDSLSELQDLVGMGQTEFQDELTAVEGQIDMLTNLRLLVSNLDSALLERQTLLNEENTEILSGDIGFNLTFLNTGTDLIYESDVLHSLPLSYTDEFTGYRINLEGTDYQLELGYSLSEILDANRTYLLRADSITALSSTFTFLEIGCINVENCRSGETIIIAYF